MVGHTQDECREVSYQIRVGYIYKTWIQPFRGVFLQHRLLAMLHEMDTYTDKDTIWIRGMDIFR